MVTALSNTSLKTKPCGNGVIGYNGKMAICCLSVRKLCDYNDGFFRDKL